MPELTAKQQGTLRLLNLNASPFPEIREILARQGRDLASIQDVSIQVETREVKSEDGEWENHEPTGVQKIKVVFDQVVFESDSNGIRLAE